MTEPIRDFVIERRGGGLYALGDPDEVDFARDVLENSDRTMLTFDGDILTLWLTDEVRRYRLLEWLPGGDIARTQRIRTTT